MQSVRRGALALSLITAIVILATLPALAQTAPQIEQLQVDLWPEFDRSDMLIIYRGRLAPDTPLPATLTLRLPARVGAPHAVAYDDGSGNLLEADYTSALAGDWVAVTLQAPALNFQLEFYDQLDRTDDQRSYSLVWPGDYAVGQLDVMLLLPPGASEVRTEPVLSPLEGAADASRYGRPLGSFDAGQEARLAVSYRGGTTAVRVSPVPLPPAGADNSLLIAGAVGAALLLVVVGVVWYTRRPAPQVVIKSPPRRSQRPTGQRRRAQPSLASYCTRCGRALHKDDRFCGHCGTPVDKA